MNDLKMKKTLIHLLTNNHFFEVVEGINVKKYLKDYIRNSKEFQITDEFLDSFYIIHAPSKSKIFKIEYFRHNEGTDMITIQDPEKNVATMIISDNKEYLSYALQAASMLDSALKAFNEYSAETARILEIDNDGRFVYFDLQECNIWLKPEHQQVFIEIMKEMAKAKNVEYSSLKDINFKFSFKAWKNNEHDDEWI